MYSASKKVNINYDPQYFREKCNPFLQQEYTIYTRVHLLGLTRVLLSVPCLFENKNGEIDNSVKSALVFSVGMDIGLGDSVKRGIRGDKIHHCKFDVGRYIGAKFRPIFDRDHKLVKKELIGYFYRYWIEDSKGNIRDVIKKFGEPSKTNPYNVAEAIPGGITLSYSDRKFTAFDKDEWISADLKELIEATKN